MKRILILLVLVSGCKKEVYYYPSKNKFTEYNPTELNISSLNFRQIVDTIRYGLSKKNPFYFSIEDVYKVYNFMPYVKGNGLYKEKNGILIRNDSIGKILLKHKVESSSEFLKMNYENNGKQIGFPDSYNRVYIDFVLNISDTSEKLKSSLIKFFKVYKKTRIKYKDSINLNIILEYPMSQVYGQPNPPIPFEIEYE